MCNIVNILWLESFEKKIDNFLYSYTIIFSQRQKKISNTVGSNFKINNILQSEIMLLWHFMIKDFLN